jgi:hypothetical protein
MMMVPAYLEGGMHELRIHDFRFLFSRFICIAELAPGYEFHAQLCITRVEYSEMEKDNHMTDSNIRTKL